MREPQARPGACGLPGSCRPDLPSCRQRGGSGDTGGGLRRPRPPRHNGQDVQGAEACSARCLRYCSAQGGHALDSQTRKRPHGSRTASQGRERQGFFHGRQLSQRGRKPHTRAQKRDREPQKTMTHARSALTGPYRPLTLKDENHKRTLSKAP